MNHDSVLATIEPDAFGAFGLVFAVIYYLNEGLVRLIRFVETFWPVFVLFAGLCLGSLVRIGLRAGR